MKLTLIADVQPTTVSWLWPGRIPFGKLTILDGDGGLGKSTLLLDLAARLSRGVAFPDGPPHEPAGTVLLAVEDGISDTHRPRLEAAGADLERIAVLEAVLDAEGNEDIPTIPDDVGTIELACGAVGAKLVIIDPIMSYLAGGTNSHSDHEVRRALTPLAAFAERSGVAVVLVRHLNKTTGGKAIYRGNGSIAFIGVVRSALIVAEDPDDEYRRVIAVSKSNLAARPPSLAYRLTDTGNGVARVAWEGISGHTADSLLNTTDDEERSDRADAEAFLRDALTAGGKPGTELIAEARGLGIGERTLRAAKAGLHIGSEKELKPNGKWLWLPPTPKVAAPHTPESLHTSQPLQPLREEVNSPFNIAKDVKAAKNQAVEDGATFPAAFAGVPPVAVMDCMARCVNCGRQFYVAVGRPVLCQPCREAWEAAGHLASAD